MCYRICSAARRGWYRVRSVFDALAELAEWNRLPRKKPVFPEAGLELTPLERREVVSETMSYLLGGVGLVPGAERASGALDGEPLPVIRVQTVVRGSEEPTGPRIDPSPAPLAAWDERPARRVQPADDDSPVASRTDGVFGSFAGADGLAFGADGGDEADRGRAARPAAASPDAPSPGGGGGSEAFVSSAGVGGAAPLDVAGAPQAEASVPPAPTAAAGEAAAAAGSVAPAHAAAASASPAKPNNHLPLVPSPAPAEPSGPGPGGPTAGALLASHRYPSYVVDANKGVVLIDSANVSNYDYSTWAVDLRAQVSGATVQTYTWDFSSAPDAASISGTSTYRVQFTWGSFTGAARYNYISLTTDFGSSSDSLEFAFWVTATDSPAWSAAPTSVGTWPTVAPPDAVQADAAAMAGPHHSVNLVDGSVSTALDLPAYNPGVAPVRLVYNSLAADAQPIFVTRYEIDPSKAVPGTVDARLTVNGTPLTTYTYDTSGMNPGDFIPIALQKDATGLSTGRYSYSVVVKANYRSPVTSTFSGSFDVVNDGSSPYGAGWWVDGLDRIVSATGGVILVSAGGRSLWFADAGGGTYTRPAGDFSTLVSSAGVWTRTLPNGDTETFNSSGEMTKYTDLNNNVTTYTYSTGKLSTITDPNNLVTTFAYDGSGKLDYVTDPANRTTQITVSSGKLTAATDPASGAWAYTYDGSGRLTTITDPRSKVTTVAYDANAHRASTVTEADAAGESFTPLQLHGYPTGAPTTAEMTAEVTANFTDGRSNPWDWRMDWAGFGQPTMHVDPLGNPFVRYRDANGQAWLDNNENVERTDYDHDSQGNVTRITAPDDSRDNFTYNGYGEVLTHTNPVDHVTTYAYDAHGNQTSVTDALNQSTTATYTTDGLLKAVTDASSHTTTFGYDSRDRPTTITDPLTKVTTLAYDAASNLTASTDPLNHTTTFAYDNMGRPTQVTRPDDDANAANNPILTFTYDGLGLLTQAADPLNHLTTFAYDPLGRQQSVKDALSHVTTFTYDAAGNLKTATDPLNQTTTWSYDDRNRPVTITHPVQGVSTITYDPADQIVNYTDPLNRVTTITYTSRGQVDTIDYPTHLHIDYDYCTCGCLASYTQSSQRDPFATGEQYTLDELGRPKASTDRLGHTTTFAYDPTGNPQAVTDANNHTTTFAYDERGALKSVTDALNHTATYAYDDAGNLKSVTDPLGHIATFAYDAQNRLIAQRDALSGLTTFTYDLPGRLQSVTDPANNITTYGYDNADRRTTETDPRNKVTTFAYDDADRLSSVIDRKGQPVSFTYDAADRLTGEQWLSGGNVVYRATYTYDAGDRLTAAADANSGYNYGYAAGDGLLESIDNLSTPNMPHVTLTYSTSSQGVTKYVYDDYGAQTDYTYDDALRMTSAEMYDGSSSWAHVSFTYDNANRLTNLSRWEPGYTPTIDTAFTYDNADRLTDITHSSSYLASNLSHLTYAYDAADRLTGYTGPEGVKTYTYDNTDQLTNVAGSNGLYTETFTYDANGNRTMAGYATGTGNRMTADGTYTYTYDDNGNTLQRTQTSNGHVTDYTWDHRNRLTKVQNRNSAGGAVVYEEDYTYDVFDRRIGVNIDADGAGAGAGVQTWTLYDRDNAWADFNGAGSLTMHYLNGAGMDERYARIDSGGTVAWYLADNLGSVRQVVDKNGTVLDALTYSAFGTILSETNAGNGDRFKYTGREWDAGTGQYYYRARYYGAAVGRFTSEDPISIQLGGDIQPYRYGLNDPLTTVDRTGTTPDNPPRLPPIEIPPGWPLPPVPRNRPPQPPDPPAVRSRREALARVWDILNELAWLADLRQGLTGRRDFIRAELAENLRNARNRMRDLIAKSNSLKAEIEKAKMAGDKKCERDLQKLLNDVNEDLRQAIDAADAAAQVTLNPVTDPRIARIDEWLTYIDNRTFQLWEELYRLAIRFLFMPNR
jgi:RHS repeat-associated protein